MQYVPRNHACTMSPYLGTAKKVGGLKILHPRGGGPFSGY